MILYRSRLEEILDQMQYSYTSAFVAPPGGGKSVAIKDYLDRTGFDHIFVKPHLSKEVTWDRILKSDFVKNHPEVSACAAAVPSSAEELFAVLRCVDSHLTAPLFIVIEDAEYMDKAVLESVYDAFGRISLDRIHVIYMFEHRRNIKKVMPTGVFTIDPADLVFSIDDVKELFELNGFGLAPEELESIYTETLGWPYGIKAKLKEFSGDTTWAGGYMVQDFFRNRVYNPLDEESKYVLRVLSPLPSFTLRDAINISGVRRAAEIIPTLKTDDFFITYNRKTGTYSIHPMFRRLLMDLLMQNGEERMEAVKRGLNWMLDKKFTLEAFDLCCNFGEYSLIPKIVLSDIYHVIPRFRPWEMDGAVAKSMENATPGAKLAYILAYSYHVNLHKGRIQLEKFRTSPESKGLEAELLAADLFLGDFPCSEETKAGLGMLSEQPEKYPHIFPLNALMVRGSPYLSMLINARPGELRAVTEELTDPHNPMNRIFVCSDGTVSQLRAEYEYFTGNAEAALEHATKARYDSMGYPDLSGYLIMVKSLHALGRNRELQEMLNEASGSSITRIGFFSETKAVLNAFSAIIHGMHAAFPRQTIFSRRSVSEMDSFRTSCITIGFICLQEGDMNRLGRLADEMYCVFGEKGSVIGLVYAGIFKAACYQISDPRQAEEYMASAMACAEKDGIVMPFAELRTHIGHINISPAIRKKHGISSEFLRKVSEAYEKYRHEILPKYELSSLPRLTSRETDIMDAYSRGLTQSEIAARYGISIETVRQHLKNIYAKMGVNKKSAAVELFSTKIKKS